MLYGNRRRAGVQGPPPPAAEAPGLRDRNAAVSVWYLPCVLLLSEGRLKP